MKRKLLLHTCCAPCLVAPYYDLKNDFKITVFWHNHNIHPYYEYQARRCCVLSFVKKEKISIKEYEIYNMADFALFGMKYMEERCYHCYYDRMLQTVKFALKKKFETFSTTLLYSKYQKHDIIKKVCEDLANEYQIEFFYKDFRPLWQQGIKLSKEHNMYRQKYCGCVFSYIEGLK